MTDGREVWRRWEPEFSADESGLPDVRNTTPSTKSSSVGKTSATLTVVKDSSKWWRCSWGSLATTKRPRGCLMGLLEEGNWVVSSYSPARAFLWPVSPSITRPRRPARAQRPGRAAAPQPRRKASTANLPAGPSRQSVGARTPCPTSFCRIDPMLSLTRGLPAGHTSQVDPRLFRDMKLFRRAAGCQVTGGPEGNRCLRAGPLGILPILSRDLDSAPKSGAYFTLKDRPT